MSEPFIAEIRIMSFNFAPKGWALCNGQFLPINQNQPLFALLGTTYGGNGQTTFALPDLRERASIHMGSGHTLGEKGGSSAVTLNTQQMPTHPHFFSARTGVAQNAVFSDVPSANPVQPPPNPPGPYQVELSNAFGSLFYGASANLVPMDQTSLTNVGGSQPHQNMMPYLALTFCIALQGIFPSQN
jgi:microcystin-dependent protein